MRLAAAAKYVASDIAIVFDRLDFLAGYYLRVARDYGAGAESTAIDIVVYSTFKDIDSWHFTCCTDLGSLRIVGSVVATAEDVVDRERTIAIFENVNGDDAVDVAFYVASSKCVP